MPLPYFSLVHATYNSQLSLADHFDKWIRTARDPGAIEYIFALEEGDLNALEAPSGFQIVKTQSPDEYSTSVLNWNSAAAASTGQVLVTVSDDLTPPPNWDYRLREAIGQIDPSASRFVVKVDDSQSKFNSLVSHPIVSRAHYRDLGLFDSRYRSMFCDNDFTWTAFLRSQILDLRTLVFTHGHPHIGDFPETESQAKNNRRLEYEYGASQFKKKWPFFIEPAAARSLPLAHSLSTAFASRFLKRAGVLLRATRNQISSRVFRFRRG